MTPFKSILTAGAPVTIGGVPDGAEAFVLADIAGTLFATGADVPGTRVVVRLEAASRRASTRIVCENVATVRERRLSS